MPPVRGDAPVTPLPITRGLMFAPTHSCPYKEGRPSSGRWQGKNKVQDQVLALPLHTVARRQRKGGEAEAESATWYVGPRDQNCSKY